MVNVERPHKSDDDFHSLLETIFSQPLERFNLDMHSRREAYLGH
jgi:hypothetical protein